MRLRGYEAFLPRFLASSLPHFLTSSLPHFLTSSQPHFLTASQPHSLWRRLTGCYVRATVWYLLAVTVLWLVGIESIYGSPTPFYALVRPVFPPFSPFSLFQLFTRFGSPLFLFLGFFAALMVVLRRLSWFEEEPSRRAASWLLFGMVAFLFLFSGAVAMIHDGSAGISQAYSRQTYEYAGDIGKTRSIYTLFRDYLKLQPYLSMHAKVHPPGPVTVLWVFSYVTGQSALGLSLATMAAGSLGLVPLYLWAADLAGRRVALTCCMLYSLIPSIVLFTATSADIFFTPVSITALFLFWRALHRRSVGYALTAGACYALASFLSFSLLTLGAFFAFVGLWRFGEKRWRASVIQTAVVMVLSFLAVHVAVRWWTGFDMIACFQACQAQFYLDQANLDLMTPRFPSWAFKFINPACWFFYAGIPVSVLFVWRIARPDTDTKALFIVFALTLLTLTLLYFGRGEGERSAMYIFPFVALPAAHLLNQFGRAEGSHGPLAATLVFMALQCWLMESCLYTFW